jgi:hypothetical protein
MLKFAARADVKALGAFPVRYMPAVITAVALWKTASEKVLMTGLFVRKTRIKFSLVLGEIFSDHKFIHCWPPV